MVLRIDRAVQGIRDMEEEEFMIGIFRRLAVLDPGDATLFREVPAGDHAPVFGTAEDMGR